LSVNREPGTPVQVGRGWCPALVFQEVQMPKRGPAVAPLSLNGEQAPASSAGVYGITVAAELAGCGIQALRLYEQRGLINPARTSGGTRRYSLDNIHRVQRITGMLDSGVNLAGIVEIFRLEEELAQARAELHRAGERKSRTRR
jgi:hypothetical protein